MAFNRWAILAACMVTHLLASVGAAQSPQSSRLLPTPGCDGQGRFGCACAKCQTHSRPSSTFLDRQLQKIADLNSRRYQLPQHIGYDSPLEASYYFRPYQVHDIEKQRQFMGFSKNPYDNRMFESLYSQTQEVEHLSTK